MLSVNLLGSVQENSEKKLPRVFVPHRNTTQDPVSKTRTGILMNRESKCHSEY